MGVAPIAATWASRGHAGCSTVAMLAVAPSPAGCSTVAMLAGAPSPEQPHLNTYTGRLLAGSEHLPLGAPEAQYDCTRPLVKGSVVPTMMGVLHLPLGAGTGAGGGAGTVVVKQAGNKAACSCTCCFMLATTRPGRRPPAWQMWCDRS